MTKDEIIRMAIDSGLYGGDPSMVSSGSLLVTRLERFASLVASAERKACVEACKAQRQLLGENEAKIGSLAIAMCVDAISTRGKK